MIKYCIGCGATNRPFVPESWGMIITPCCIVCFNEEPVVQVSKSPLPPCVSQTTSEGWCRRSELRDYYRGQFARLGGGEYDEQIYDDMADDFIKHEFYNDYPEITVDLFFNSTIWEYYVVSKERKKK
jgi:hypothetical protein